MLDDFQMDDVNCDGTEETLGDCKYIKNDNCGTHEGAGVVCSDPYVSANLGLSQMFNFMKTTSIRELLV